MIFPVEASRSLQLRLFHRLGNHQYVLTLELQAGDNVQDRVLEVFQQRKLPGCLYKSTLEYVVLAVRESLSDVDQPALGLRRDSLSDLEQTTGGHLPFSPSARSTSRPRPPAGYDVRLDSSLLELEELRWPRLLASGGASLPRPTEEMTFWCAYDFLLRHRPAFFRTIGTLEDTYLMENRELQAGRLRSISQLQMRQSIEMENVRAHAEKIRVDDAEGVSRDVQSLVAQHVGELDAVELHWRTEIDMLKVKQKASYRDLIVDFFEQEIEQIRQAHESGGELAAADSAALESAFLNDVTASTSNHREAGGLAQPLRSEPVSSLPPVAPVAADEPLPAATSKEQAALQSDAKLPDSKLQEVAEVRAVFGQQKVFFVLRLWVGDIMDLLHQAPSPVSEEKAADAWALHRDSDGLGSQLPPNFVGLGSYGNRYFARGSALPVEGVGWSLIQHGMTAGLPATRTAGVGAASLKGNKAGTYRSPSLGFWAVPSLPRQVELSPNAYAAHLRGLVIPTPENLKFETMQAVMLREFASRCNQFTDLHFAPLAEQLQLVKAATGDAPLKTGDYFCTRHSNLGGAVQVAFHLLTGSSEASASDEIPASVHRALQRVICDCQGCHVAELSLPLLLLDIGTSESSLPYAVAQRRSENALRALKGALTQLADELAPSELPELAVLNLVLPPSCAQSISARVPSVVETTLTFLQHSFQCV